MTLPAPAAWGRLSRPEAILPLTNLVARLRGLIGSEGMELSRSVSAQKRQQGMSPPMITQMTRVYDLFVEATCVRDIRQVKQALLAQFADILRQLPPSYRKSPKDTKKSLYAIIAENTGVFGQYAARKGCEGFPLASKSHSHSAPLGAAMTGAMLVNGILQACRNVPARWLRHKTAAQLAR
ncbi:MAG: hypothetical protein GX413_12655 [Acetobacter sp.]|nr:hypothetical protein [Acetobacter sp.]